MVQNARSAAYGRGRLPVADKDLLAVWDDIRPWIARALQPTPVWGSVTGDLTDQDDLVAALDGKVSSGAVTTSGLTMSPRAVLGRTSSGDGSVEELTSGFAIAIDSGLISVDKKYVALSGAIVDSGLTMPAGVLLGRSTVGIAAVEHISIGAGLTLAAGVLAATATPAVWGSVSGLITDQADLMGELSDKADAINIASCGITIANNRLAGRTTSGGAGLVEEISVGAGLTLAAGVLAATTAVIADESVTNPKLAHVATNTIKGRADSGAGDVQDLSVAQLRAMLAVPYVLDSETGDPVRTISSTGYSTIYSYTIPADTLAVGVKLRLGLAGDLLQNSGSSQSFKMRVYLGGTRVFGTSASNNVPSDSDRRPWRIDCDLAYRGVGEQFLSLDASLGYAEVPGGNGIGRWFTKQNDGVGACHPTEDETTALTLDIQFAWNSSATSSDMRLYAAHLEYLPGGGS